MSYFNSNMLEDFKHFSRGGIVSELKMSPALASFSNTFSVLSQKSASLHDAALNSRDLAVALTCDMDLYDESNESELIPGFIQISEDLFELLFEKLQNITVIDQDGYPYEFIEDHGTLYNNIYGYLNRDPFLGSDAGEYFIRIKVRSKGFWRTDEQHPYEPGLPAVDAGKEMYFADLVRQLLCSADLNECIADTVDDILQCRFSLDGFNSKWVNSGLVGVRSFAEGVISSFSKGGLLGVGQYILSYFSSFTGSTVDSDGFIKLTDNNSYIPKEYIAGTISTIVSSITDIISSIIALIYPPVGMAIKAIGSIVSFIPRMIASDFNSQTHAALDDSENIVCFPYCPVASFQEIISRSDLLAYFSNDPLTYEIISTVGDQIPIFIVNVVGGCLVFGRADNNHFACEFHPSMVSMTDNLNRITPVLGRTTAYGFGYNRGIVLSTLSIRTKYFSGKPLDLNNNQYGVLSADDEQLLLATFLRNTYLYKLFISIGAFEQSPSYTSDYFQHPISIPLILSPTGGNTITDPWNYSIMRPILSFFYSPLSTFSVPGAGTIYDGYWVKNYCNDWTKYISIINSDNNEDYDWSVETCNIPKVIYSEDHDTWTYSSQSVMNDELIYDNSISPLANIAYWDVKFILKDRQYLGDIVPITYRYKFSIDLPLYNPSTFILWTTLSLITAAVAITAGAVITVKVRKWRTQRRQMNEAAVEAAWANLVENNTTENQALYKKAYKKNNRWSALTGGTKYDSNGFWSQGGTGTDSMVNRLMRTENTSNDNINEILKKIQLSITGK